MEMSEEEKKAQQIQEAEVQKRRFSGRSSSVGATPNAKFHVPNGRAASMAAFPSSSAT